MARITRLHVENFRSIESLTLDLDKTVTLLVGPNGAGKSNIIDAISFVADALNLGLDIAIGHRDGIGAVRRRPPVAPHGKTGRPVDIRLEIEVRASKPVDGSSRWGFGFTLGARQGGAWYIKEEWLSHGKRLTFHMHEKHGIAQGPADLDLDDERLSAPLLGRRYTAPIKEALESYRRFDISPATLRAPQAFGQSLALAPNGSNLNQVWATLESQHPRVSGRIITLLSQILPKVVAIRSQSLGRYRTLEAEFRLDDGHSVTIDGAGLSDGTLRALALLVAVYQPTSTSLIALEEPEKALHPYAAELLFNALLSAPSSPPLLISTHSPSILASGRFELGMLRVVEWREGRTVVGPIASELLRDVTNRLTSAPDLMVEGNLTLEEEPRRYRSLRPPPSK